MDGPAHLFRTANIRWNWAGAEPIFARAIRFDGSSGPLVLCFQMFAVGLAGIIPISSGAGRWRLAPICLSSALLAAIAFPLFSHWVWGGGWLSRLNVDLGLGAKFVDAGGSSTIHVVGGLSALSIVWLLGPHKVSMRKMA